jgi:hypothetical protein
MAEEVLIHLLKPFCMNICRFPMNIFFRSEVAVVNFVLEGTPEEKVTRIKIG